MVAPSASIHLDLQRTRELLMARRTMCPSTDIKLIILLNDDQPRVARRHLGQAVDVREPGARTATSTVPQQRATVETDVAHSVVWNCGLRLLRQDALEGHLRRDVPLERGIVGAVEFVPPPRASRAGGVAEPAGLRPRIR